MTAKEVVDAVRALQASLEKSAGESFVESEIESMKVLIRLTVEFYYFLRQPPSDWGVRGEIRYRYESVFSGISSFWRVTDAYRSLVGRVESSVPWRAINVGDLEAHFISLYNLLLMDSEFPIRCRALLDSFRVQLLFCTTAYED